MQLSVWHHRTGAKAMTDYTQFMISATSCREMMPDPAFYRQCLQESFDDMLAAAENKLENAA